MQPLCEAPRDGLTPAQVIDVVQNSPAVSWSAGLQLVDLGLNVLDDVSDDLVGGRIERNSYAELHASVQLQVSRVLDWGAGLIRPYATATAAGVSAAFYLGAYHLPTPARPLGESPPTYAVTGYDMLLRLNQSVGDAYAIAAGESYLGKVEEILLSCGYAAYLIDQSAAATVLPIARAWAFDEQTTWLKIVNDLLDAIGYAGIWSDWAGRLRCEPYQLPANRSVEWTYTDDVATTMLTREGTIEQDYFDAPNRWVFYRSNRVDETPPVEGNGKFIYVNQSVGPTSVEGRGGLIVAKPPVGVDVADHASLLLVAQRQIAQDMDVPTTIQRPTAVNPMAWHFDRLYVQDGSSDLVADAQCTAWSFALAPEIGDMRQTWRAIAQ